MNHTKYIAGWAGRHVCITGETALHGPAQVARHLIEHHQMSDHSIKELMRDLSLSERNSGNHRGLISLGPANEWIATRPAR